MRSAPILLTLVTTLGLTACEQSNSPMLSTRSAPHAALSQSAMESETALNDQAQALTSITRSIVHKSTANGAAIGALAGCGLVLISASNAQNCVAGAVVGGAVGAVAGNAHGKQQVAKRVELVSPSALVRSLAKANDKMERVSADLPALLARQDAELAALNSALERGEITSDRVAKRHAEISAHRAELTEALTLSAAQANAAHANLKSAQTQGQTGLDWHLSATKSLAREATSARSKISLL